MHLCRSETSYSYRLISSVLKQNDGNLLMVILGSPIEWRHAVAGLSIHLCTMVKQELHDLDMALPTCPEHCTPSVSLISDDDARRYARVPMQCRESIAIAGIDLGLVVEQELHRLYETPLCRHVDRWIMEGTSRAVDIYALS